MRMDAIALLLSLTVVAASSQARAASFELASAPNARLDVSFSSALGTVNRSVDVSSLLDGHLQIEPLVTPLGTSQVARLELSLDETLLFSPSVPGLPVPIEFQIDSVSWHAPQPTQPMTPLNLTLPNSFWAEFPGTQGSLTGSYRLGALPVTPVDATVPYSPLQLPFIPDGDALEVGYDAVGLHLPIATVNAYWIAGELIRVQISTTLFIDRLRFGPVPEPGTAALAALALVGLVLRRSFHRS